jgi:phosphate ABC transporter phosphate-binding protein
MTRTSYLLGTLAVTVLLTGCGERHVKQLRAGGSTFAFPIMSKWSGEYFKSKGIEVQYGSQGSGSGIEGMIAREFDFGCTDGPMTDEELKRASEKGGAVLHIPLAMGAVAPIYRLDDVKEPLRFTGPVLADIFLGKIVKWNDPALQALNPHVKLPDRTIAVVHREDSSGTTYVFTDFLSKVSPEWQTRMGTAKLVKWPVGQGAHGNEKVAGIVKQSPDAIGYAELTYGIQDAMQYGLVKNSYGEFIKPTPSGVTAAAQQSLAKIPGDLRFSMTNAPGADCYPISGTVWAVLYPDQTGPRGKAVVDFLRWVLHDGQQFTGGLHYAPLPESLRDRAEQRLDQVKLAGK